MKRNKILAMMIGLVWVMSCGKPHDPETITPDDVSGGYAIISRHITAGSAQDVVVRDSLAYIAQGEGGLMIVDVKKPANPETVSILTQNVRGYSTRIAAKDSMIYIAAGTFGITSINIANPFEPIPIVWNFPLKPARNVIINGDYLFVAVSETGVKIAHVGDPLDPWPRGDISTAGYAYGLTITADTNKLLVATGEMGLSIFDISIFNEGYGPYPHEGWCDTPGYAESVVVSDKDDIAFLACGDAGLQIIDYSDTLNVHIAGSLYHSGYAKALIYRSDRIYMAARRGGLQIIDVTDVTNPKLIGVVNTESAMGVDEKNGLIYLADEVEGLLIIDKYVSLD
jgi:hypothetical protein